MKYGVTFLLLGVGCLLVAGISRDFLGWGAVAIVYPGASFLLLALAYTTTGPGLLGKQATGGRSLVGTSVGLAATARSAS